MPSLSASDGLSASNPLRPIVDLGRKFREEVFALASEAQLASVLASVSEAAAQHGLTIDKSDAQLLHLTRE